MGRIMSLSSWSSMWQWKTNLPVKPEKGAITRVVLPTGTRTVSFQPISFGSGATPSRSRIWNWVAWMWMGWTVWVRLVILQISVVFAFGVSLTGSLHSLGTADPFTIFPSWIMTGSPLGWSSSVRVISRVTMA